MSLIVYFVIYMFVVFLHVTVHELGHLFFGLISGYKFSLFSLFGLILYHQDGRFKVGKSNGIIVGQCLMYVPDEHEDLSIVLLNLGGGIFNLILSCFLVLLFILTHPSTYISFFYLFGAIVGFLMAGLNLIPLNLGVPNDGMNLKEASKSKEAKQAFYIMLNTNEKIIRGKSIGMFDEHYFDVHDESDLNNYLILYSQLLKASCLYEKGRVDDCFDLLKHLSRFKMPSYYRLMLEMILFEIYLMDKQNFLQAKRLYNQKPFQKLLKANIPTMSRLLAAYYFLVCDDIKKANTYLSEAKKMNKHYYMVGIKLVEDQAIKKLENLMIKSANQ